MSQPETDPLPLDLWREVIAAARLPPTMKLVALALGTYATFRDGSNARPGQALLAEVCGVSDRTVRAHLAALADYGLILRTERGSGRSGRADVYQLTQPVAAHEVGLTYSQDPRLLPRASRR